MKETMVVRIKEVALKDPILVEGLPGLAKTLAVIGLRRSISHSARARRLPGPASKVGAAPSAVGTPGPTLGPGSAGLPRSRTRDSSDDFCQIRV